MQVLALVPLSLLAVVALLVVADALERRSAALVVRLALRPATAPDVAEQVVAAELAPVLAAEGLDARSPAPA